MVRQGSVGGSNKQTVTPSAKTKHNAVSKRDGYGSGMDSEDGEIVRRSPYVRRVAKRGSNRISGVGFNSGSLIQTVPSSAPPTKPKTEAPIRELTLNRANTFVDSVLSLCSKSIASCNVISVPVPREDIFLSLVALCGTAEAKFWSEFMGFEYEKSYALLSKLL
jgi:hypothetical protein